MRGGVGKGLGLGLEKQKKRASGAQITDPLDLVVASTCCDLDATLSASYGGSGQTWSNIITSPADGAAQTDYDFWLGHGAAADALDPTFTGSAGSQTAYFLVDGSQEFQSKAIANMPTLKNMHRTDQSGIWIATVQHVAGTTGNVAHWGNSGGAANRGGRTLTLSADGNLDYFFYDGTAQSRAQDIVSITTGSYVLLISSWDPSSITNNIRTWQNTKTALVDSLTFQTDTTSATNEFNIGGAAQANLMNNNSRIVHFSCGNEFLDDTKAGAIVDQLNLRHNRTYA